MNLKLLTLLIPLISLNIISEDSIDVSEVRKYVGTLQNVCGRVISTKYLKRTSGGPIFLNMGRDYPNQQLTGLIWYGRYKSNFSYRPDKFLKRKTVCIKGNVGVFEGTPQIQINSESQITLVD